MKVLFLDIDGVLNCATTRQLHRGFLGIDPDKAALIVKIRHDTGCKIVLSSSWRKFPDGPKEVQRHVGDLLDVTPDMPLGLPIGACERGKEIEAWLSKRPEVTRYAIVDDDNDMLPEQQPHFFQTHFKGEGLTPDVAIRIAEHLKP